MRRGRPFDDDDGHAARVGGGSSPRSTCDSPRTTSCAPTYWLVDPTTRTLEALRLDGELWVETGNWGEGDVARVEPFEAIELDVGRLFVPVGRGG